MNTLTLSRFIVVLTVAFAGCQTTTYTVDDAMVVEPFTTQENGRVIPEAETDTQVSEKETDSQKMGRAIQKATTPLEASVVYARELERRGELDEAMKLYLTILEATPNHPLANHRIGIVLSRKQELGSAMEYFATALQNDADNEELLADYGYCCFLRGDLVRAERLLLHAVTNKPDYERAQNNLGVLYAQSNQAEKALSCFRLAGCDEATSRTRLLQASKKPNIEIPKMSVADSSRALKPAKHVVRESQRMISANTPTGTKNGGHFDNPFTEKPVIQFAPEPPNFGVVQAGFVTNQPSNVLPTK